MSESNREGVGTAPASPVGPGFSPVASASERRVHVRHPANVVVAISTDERRDRVGVTSDVSTHGLLVHSLSRFAVGERVSLMYRYHGVESVATGRVVRAERDDRWMMFPHATAVQLDRPQPALLSFD